MAQDLNGEPRFEINYDPLPLATCRECGYPLRGLASSDCPECGQAFDPLDLDTMRGPWTPELKRWRRKQRARRRERPASINAAIYAVAGGVLLVAGSFETYARRESGGFVAMSYGLFLWTFCAFASVAALRSKLEVNRRRRWLGIVLASVALTFAIVLQRDECPHAAYWRFGLFQYVQGEACGNPRYYRPWFIPNPRERN